MLEEKRRKTPFLSILYAVEKKLALFTTTKKRTNDDKGEEKNRNHRQLPFRDWKKKKTPIDQIKKGKGERGKSGDYTAPKQTFDTKKDTSYTWVINSVRQADEEEEEYSLAFAAHAWQRSSVFCSFFPSFEHWRKKAAANEAIYCLLFFASLSLLSSSIVQIWPSDYFLLLLFPFCCFSFCVCTILLLLLLHKHTTTTTLMHSSSSSLPLDPETSLPRRFTWWDAFTQSMYALLLQLQRGCNNDNNNNSEAKSIFPMSKDS